jgi:ribosome-associated toxin RatA of RatAB toxin-antitoxin module
MRQVQRSAIVPHPVDAMRALITDVAEYPRFLPGCTGGCVVGQVGDVTTARLDIARGPVATTFTTRNTLVNPGHLRMELVDGPFRQLHGDWRLTPLGDDGCRVELTVAFEFRNRAADLLMGAAFERLCNEIVDAFVARAAVVYGQSRA